ncbi:hypothetical protein LTR78_007288 [Recurvomyces mirabilis]|uniref:Uncharacterized protein n=1 Tax=Recurvomyces mirabilis TaxID=574656 RepID=A0AAE0WJN0_9PEZI|nr:hypothetical protein LTR78_007288 [Recurvomyces mirabilis]KAK5155471.1 hypothetical protein LTS14_005732 [Recurvomyces mirabilis]
MTRPGEPLPDDKPTSVPLNLILNIIYPKPDKIASGIEQLHPVDQETRTINDVFLMDFAQPSYELLTIYIEMRLAVQKNKLTIAAPCRLDSKTYVHWKDGEKEPVSNETWESISQHFRAMLERGDEA